jgi:ribonuclease HI
MPAEDPVTVDPSPAAGWYQERLAADLDLFTEPHRDRVIALRRYMRRQRDLEVAELVSEAVAAAFAGDHDAAAGCLDRAETLAAKHPAIAPPEPKPRISLSLTEVLAGGLRGQASVPAGTGMRMVATDGSRNGPYYGWGYIATTGEWGCAAEKYGSKTKPDGDLDATLAEFHAVGMACADLPGPAMILTDSTGIIPVLIAWKAGFTDRIPSGAALDGEVSRARQKALAAAARAVACHRGRLIFRHVRGHAGHTLNEAADTLARLARQYRSGERRGDLAEVTARATGVAEGFLQAWHGTGA